ncbi:MAG: ATP-binding cassette domain-containing protein [Desulfobulbaceae bacterium]|nr:ATP-binding cassette domain-containing protein [Desulfobulbaceae bacterium]
MEPILSAEHVDGGYRDRKVLHDITFSVGEGERVLVIGPNGCGKTTLLKILVGALSADHGSVRFKGLDITKIPQHLRMQRGIGYLMQTRNVFPSLSVNENLHLSYWHGNGDFRAQRDRLLHVFPMLKDRLSSRAGILSGGERQALAVCMVMMRPVTLLLLDEPTAGLAPKAAEDILRAIHEAQETFGFTTVIVEHNLRMVHRWVSRVVVMKQGRIAGEENDPSSLLDHDRLQGYYFE